MISCGYQFDQEILERYHLSIEEIKSSKSDRRVYLVRDNVDQSLKILKINLAFPQKLEREYKFLDTAAALQFNFLKIPMVYAFERGAILMEYLDIKNYTRDTILEKEWSDKECQLFVQALREFQSVKQSSWGFSFYEKLKGINYPLLRTLETIKLILKTLSFFQILNFCLLLFQYTLARFFIRNVTTHYDLNTFNFTNLENSDKMAMIDFEMGAFRGDNYFDILYYLSIPPISLNEWSFQTDLLSAWIENNNPKNNFFKIRLRVLLCTISFQRIKRFHKDPIQANVYRENLKIILSSGNFNSWYNRFQ